VPCTELPPKSAADHRPVTDEPHPGPRPAEPKRLIELFRGIVFRCIHSSRFDWSRDACAKITVEVVSQAKAANIPLVLIGAGDDPPTKRQKAEAAGIPLDDSVNWYVTFTPDDSSSAVTTKAT